MFCAISFRSLGSCVDKREEEIVFERIRKKSLDVQLYELLSRCKIQIFYRYQINVTVAKCT